MVTLAVEVRLKVSRKTASGESNVPVQEVALDEPEQLELAPGLETAKLSARAAIGTTKKHKPEMRAKQARLTCVGDIAPPAREDSEPLPIAAVRSLPNARRERKKVTASATSMKSVLNRSLCMCVLQLWEFFFVDFR